MPDNRSIPPVAMIKPVEHRTHDDVRLDNYYWLRAREDQEVLDYLAAENAYTAAIMADTEPLQAQLYKAMRGYIQEADQSVPVQMDDTSTGSLRRYLYYERTEEGKQYTIYCRKRDSLAADEEILLDLNQLAEQYEYVRLANFKVSPNHKLLAYALDVDGSEVFTLRVKDLESGTHLPDEIAHTYYGLEWASDNRTLFYITLDAAKRPFKLFRHRLGDDPETDVLVYHETDELYNLGIRKSKSNRYIFVNLFGHTTTEVRFIDSDDPTQAPTLVQPRIHNMEYSVSHHQAAARPERFFILTNWEAQNFRVMEAPVDVPGRENWREVIPHREAVMLDGIECFSGYLVVYERENGRRHIRVQDLQTGEGHRVVFDEPVYTISQESNPTFESQFLRYSYNSLVQPPTVYDYDMSKRYQMLRKAQAVPGYQASQYTSKQLWANAEDGTRIPISLVHHKDLKPDGHNPTLLYGYGSYGFSLDPGFNSNRIVLLERGFVVAIAHIRGGSEMGRSWYESGKFLHKKNTFTDFIACAEHLIEQGYTNPSKLAISGRSAGGLLMGAVVNLRPDLFAAVVAGVPFVDVINTMLDPTIPLTVPEWEEWGNPNDPEYYAYMKSYSPYDNVEVKAYPPILATAGLNDPRVQYWEPAKWVARLRAVKTDDNLLLLKTHLGAGHFSSSGRFDYLKDLAFEYAFVLKVLGMRTTSQILPVV